MAGGPLGTSNCMSYLSHNLVLMFFIFLLVNGDFLSRLKFSEQNLDAFFYFSPFLLLMSLSNAFYPVFLKSPRMRKASGSQKLHIPLMGAPPGALIQIRTPREVFMSNAGGASFSSWVKVKECGGLWDLVPHLSVPSLCVALDNWSVSLGCSFHKVTIIVASTSGWF